jgi:hypothetical protein
MPEQLATMLDSIEEAMSTNVDIYFCPQLFSSKKVSKESVSVCPALWADLDECSPDNLEEKPSFVAETSPGRYQALWILDPRPSVGEAEDFSKRIAYKYAEQGADLSGWDLTQLLRVPGTINRKYFDGTDAIRVQLVANNFGMYRLAELEQTLPPVKISDYEKIPFPDVLPDIPAARIMENYRFKLPNRAFILFTEPPQGPSWSEPLFQLMMQCYEAGMSREEVFVVATAAACNKFARDQQSPTYLWQDVCRAWGRHNANVHALRAVSESPVDLLTAEEFERVKDKVTFVERYIEWATGLGDAASQYHQAGAFVILSGLLSGSISLPTSFGRLIPNLWFMILADTTLTRKSTAMDIAVDLLAEVDSETIMATDGSIEGLLQGLSTRPGRPSIFLRDEFSGLLEQFTKRDYYAGMAETLTKLYDGKIQKRVLRKETIEVINPVLIVFAGGIRSRVQQLLKFDHISSGFIPRFVFLTAETDTARIRPLGPPSEQDTAGRIQLLAEMRELSDFYSGNEVYETANGTKLQKPKTYQARLTPEAWTRYNEFEKRMLDAGMDTERPDLMTPLYDRLAKSTLKAVVLLAATSQRNDEVVISLDDVLLGIRYAAGWREYAVDVVNGVGRSAVEHQLDAIFGNIRRNPGISRGVLMRNYHLTALEASAIFNTLEQRGLITPSKVGKATVYNAS